MSYGGRGGGGFRGGRGGRGGGGGDSFRGRGGGGFNSQRFNYSPQQSYDRRSNFSKGNGGERFSRGGRSDDYNNRRSYRQEGDFRDFHNRNMSPEPPRKRMRGNDSYGGLSPRRSYNPSQSEYPRGYNEKSSYDRGRDVRERLDDYPSRKFGNRGGGGGSRGGLRSSRGQWGSRRSTAPFSTRTGFVTKRRLNTTDFRKRISLSARNQEYIRRVRQMRLKRRARSDESDGEEKHSDDDEDGKNDEEGEEIEEEEIEEEEEVEEEDGEGMEEDEEEEEGVEGETNKEENGTKDEPEEGELEDTKKESGSPKKGGKKTGQEDTTADGGKPTSESPNKNNEEEEDDEEEEGQPEEEEETEEASQKATPKKKVVKKTVVKKVVKVIKKAAKKKSEKEKEKGKEKEKSNEEKGSEEKPTLKNFLGQPFINLKCPHCHFSCDTFKQYSFHFSSKKHANAMKEVSTNTRHKLAALRHEQREEQRELDEKSKDLRLKTFFCNICKLNYRTLKSDHQQSKFHRKIREILLPNCKVCRISFKTSISYESHLADISHIKRKARMDRLKTLPPKDDDMAEGELDPNNFMVLDAVGSGDEESDEAKEGAGEAKKKPKTHDIGTEYCKKIEVFYCELCEMYLSKKDDQEKVLTVHCRTRVHLQRYVRKKEKEARAKAEAELEANRAAQKQIKKENKAAEEEAKKKKEANVNEEEEEGEEHEGNGEDHDGEEEHEGDAEEEEDEDKKQEKGEEEQAYSSADKELTDLLDKAQEELRGEMTDDEQPESPAEERFNRLEKCSVNHHQETSDDETPSQDLSKDSNGPSD